MLLGLTILIMCVALAFLIYSFGQRIIEANAEGCACVAEGDFCPMGHNTAPVEVYVGYTVVILLGAVGGFLIFSSRQAEVREKEARREWEKVLKTLNGDEKTVYETISSSDGVIFQSDLVEKVQWPKVKVSRVLDRLEARGLVERRRRGMSNIIILKNK